MAAETFICAFIIFGKKETLNVPNLKVNAHQQKPTNLFPSIPLETAVYYMEG